MVKFLLDLFKCLLPCILLLAISCFCNCLSTVAEKLSMGISLWTDSVLGSFLFSYYYRGNYMTTGNWKNCCSFCRAKWRTLGLQLSSLLLPSCHAVAEEVIIFGILCFLRSFVRIVEWAEPPQREECCCFLLQKLLLLQQLHGGTWIS